MGHSNKLRTVYVLKCGQRPNSKYYVGITTDVGRRFREHTVGDGGEWTRLYRAHSIVETIPYADEFVEDETTKRYMYEHGIDNVRGGSYSNVRLTRSQLESLTGEMISVAGACFKCGIRGHFSHECAYAGRKKWRIPAPNAVRTAVCRLLRDDANWNSGHTECYRCGKRGHCANQCLGV